jgi:hypothetical protein
MRLPRTTGAMSGLIVMILGAWGALIPLVGPWFHYAFGNYHAWHVTTNRIWLDIVPGAVAFIGGWMLLSSAHRTSGLFGGWLAVLAGAWFAVGPAISLIWHHAGNPIGAPTGGHVRQAFELLGYFTGLGVLIAGLAAFAMGRFVSRPRIVEEPVVAAGAPAAAAPVGAVEDRPAPAGAAAEDRPAEAGAAADDRPAVAGAPAEDRPAETGAPAQGRPVRRGGLFGRLFGRRRGAAA